MTLVVVLVVILAVAGLAVMGYRMGPAPGGRAITERDRRLQEERAERADFRSRANPNIRGDRSQAVASLAAATVRIARVSVEEQPSLSETEALAEAIVRLDSLERDSTGVSLGPLVPDLVVCLVSVGVVHRLDPGNPELNALTLDDVAANPGMVIRLAGVADLDAWPEYE